MNRNKKNITETRRMCRKLINNAKETLAILVCQELSDTWVIAGIQKNVLAIITKVLGMEQSGKLTKKARKYW